jgi:hypothetical protein
MKFRTFFAGSVAAAAIVIAGAASAASMVTYDFDAPGYWSGSFTLDVTGGVASSGSGTIDVPGYTPQSLTLIIPSDPGYESPPGYRANDGTDWFLIDQNVPIDGTPAAGGLLFSVGNTSPTIGGQPLFPIYGNGSGGFDSGLFGHIDSGPEFYEYNIDTTASIAPVPEPATWAMLLLGFFGLGVLLREHRRADRDLAALAAG